MKFLYFCANDFFGATSREFITVSGDANLFISRLNADLCDRVQNPTKMLPMNRTWTYSCKKILAYNWTLRENRPIREAKIGDMTDLISQISVLSEIYSKMFI